TRIASATSVVRTARRPIGPSRKSRLVTGRVGIACALGIVMPGAGATAVPTTPGVRGAYETALRLGGEYDGRVIRERGLCGMLDDRPWRRTAWPDGVPPPRRGTRASFSPPSRPEAESRVANYGFSRPNARIRL